VRQKCTEEDSLSIRKELGQRRKVFREILYCGRGKDKGKGKG